MIDGLTDINKKSCIVSYNIDEHTVKLIYLISSFCLPIRHNEGDKERR